MARSLAAPISPNHPISNATMNEGEWMPHMIDDNQPSNIRTSFVLDIEAVLAWPGQERVVSETESTFGWSVDKVELDVAPHGRQGSPRPVRPDRPT